MKATDKDRQEVYCARNNRGPQSIISLLAAPLETGPVTQCARQKHNLGSALKHQNKQTKTEKDITVEISSGNKGQQL